MKFAQVTKEVSNHLNQAADYYNEAAERYQVPQRVRAAADAAAGTARMAGDVARQGAQKAYRVALEHPRASAAAGIILAAALVGGVLWYVFGDWRKPAPRKRSGKRVRAGTERRTKARAARAAAT